MVAMELGGNWIKIDEIWQKIRINKFDKHSKNANENCIECQPELSRTPYDQFSQLIACVSIAKTAD